MLENFFHNKSVNASINNNELDKAISEYLAQSITTHVVETEPVIPEYQGNYAKAVFLWANGKKSAIKNDDEYPRYILYECGIRNPSDYHKQMIKEGFLAKDGFEVALEALKQNELKEIAKELNVGTSGKKADIVRRIISSGDIGYLERQTPVTFSLSEAGKAYIREYDDCIQVHRHKTFLINWNEFSEYKAQNPYASYYETCKLILFERAKKDKRLFGRLEYLYLSKLEEEFGTPKMAISYLLQVLYIDISGVMGFESYANYKKGIYNTKTLKERFDLNVPISPGIVDSIKKHNNDYDPIIIEKLYTWKLPIMICEKELFSEIVESILDNSFNYQFYKEKLRLKYENLVDRMEV